MTNNIVLSLGSNLGDRAIYLQNAIKKLENRIGRLLNVSKIYESAALGFSAKQHFLNICVVMDTSLDPRMVLEEIQIIEKSLGRTRNKLEGYASRTIDIDIIFFGNLVISDPILELPHPRFRERLFVLTPLNEVAAKLIDPITNLSVEKLLLTCTDKSAIKTYQNTFSTHH